MSFFLNFNFPKSEKKDYFLFFSKKNRKNLKIHFLLLTSLALKKSHPTSKVMDPNKNLLTTIAQSGPGYTREELEARNDGAFSFSVGEFPESGRSHQVCVAPPPNVAFCEMLRIRFGLWDVQNTKWEFEKCLVPDRAIKKAQIGCFVLRTLLTDPRHQVLIFNPIANSENQTPLVIRRIEIKSKTLILEKPLFLEVLDNSVKLSTLRVLAGAAFNLTPHQTVLTSDSELVIDQFDITYLKGNTLYLDLK